MTLHITWQHVHVIYQATSGDQYAYRSSTIVISDITILVVSINNYRQCNKLLGHM